MTADQHGSNSGDDFLSMIRHVTDEIQGFPQHPLFSSEADEDVQAVEWPGVPELLQ